jgi:transposase
MLWVLRTGAPWQDVPERYGPWRTVASRFYRWQKAGVFQRLFDALKQQADAAGQLDWQIHFVDSTIVRAHQHAAGAKKGCGNRSLRPQPGWFQYQGPPASRRLWPAADADLDTRPTA